MPAHAQTVDPPLAIDAYMHGLDGRGDGPSHHPPRTADSTLWDEGTSLQSLDFVLPIAVSGVRFIAQVDDLIVLGITWSSSGLLGAM
jgi:hypothetical protein